MTFAARDFSPRRGVSDEHIPQWICEERATKSGRKRPAALRVCAEFGLWLRCSSVTAPWRGCALLAPRHRPNWAQRTSSYLCLRPIKNTSTKPTLILDLRALQTFDRITLIRRRAAQSFKNFCIYLACPAITG